ncbi:hypothetical protein [Halopiger djelfimassiliensis]|uniref:hypothetical protein n=1 Tax=Halopiger djelfimassiliensis TaxID=1293047 RepID=UPI000677F55B|nr:hypothetical protein [Halopiger djelfimassiliensis]
MARPHESRGTRIRREPPAVLIDRADVTATDWHVRADGGPEVTLESTGPLELDGKSIYSTDQLGMDDPVSLPTERFGRN